MKQLSSSDHHHPILLVTDSLTTLLHTVPCRTLPPSLTSRMAQDSKVQASRWAKSGCEQVKSDAHTRTSPPCCGSRAMTERAGALPLLEGPGRWLSRLGRAEGNYVVDAVLLGALSVKDASHLRIRIRAVKLMYLTFHVGSAK